MAWAPEADIEQRAYAEFVRSRRSGSPVSVLVVSTGDVPPPRRRAQLRRATQTVLGAVRRYDVVLPRYAEGDLLVLAPDVDAETGAALAQRVTHATAIQTGIACFPVDGSSLPDLVRVARARSGTPDDARDLLLERRERRTRRGIPQQRTEHDRRPGTSREGGARP